MKSAFVFLALFVAKCFILECSSQSRLTKTDFKLLISVIVQVFGISWKNCGKQSNPVQMKTLKFSPDPISIPGKLTAEASVTTSAALTSPLSVDVTLKRRTIGFWITIPCRGQIGSCRYPNVCDLLDQLISPGQDCPEPLHTYGLPCHCPFIAADYAFPPLDFNISKIEFPSFLTNGNYNVQGVLKSADVEMGCFEISFSLQS
ncbi:ganglioside GM2 activator-like [Paramisgurnus dabryanus]|uniref:ganglioside GM2 activator-like n=1 Tax=Paramisgurnus dabryanus TaxID=90735 RepID=UPI003CCEFB03